MSATIEYSSDYERKGLHLGPESRFEEDTISRLEEEVKELIQTRLPTDMAQIFGLHIKTRFIATRYGSITVFFGVMLSVFSFIANYKGFFDSIGLIRSHLDLLINGLIHDRFRDELYVNVKIEAPSMEDPRRYPSDIRRLLKDLRFDPDMAESLGLWQISQQYRYGKRDAFFWFLLGLCIFLMGAVVLLVFVAIKKTYFPL
jgi:hypothetical protein